MVVNRLGLHARAAAKLVRLASTFASRIHIIRSDQNVEANAKSILSLLALAASIGTELNLKVEGSDEDAAFDAVLGLFASGFGETDHQ
jgi:phosphocarrier protein